MTYIDDTPELDAALSVLAPVAQEAAPTVALRDDLLRGAKAAADYLGIARRAVYRLTEANELPHTRVGKMFFYRKSELQRAFASAPVERRLGGSNTRSKREPVLCGSCTLGHMYPLFEKLFLEAGDTQIALLAKIKNIFRIGGLPKRTAGRGIAAYYSGADILRLLMIMEICSMGVSPTKAVAMASSVLDGAPLEMITALYGQVVSWEGKRDGTAVCIDMEALRYAAYEMLPTVFTERERGK